MARRTKSDSSTNVAVITPNDTEKVFKHKIGLVFDGGGGKGAYQMGFWRALRELGLDQAVVAIAGTSVGGLNAALFIKGDYQEAEQIWSDEIKRIKPTRIQMGVEELIDAHLKDMSFFDDSPIDCFITACNESSSGKGQKYEYSADGRVKKFCSGKAEYFNMRYLSEKQRESFIKGNTLRKEVLLATSALPVLCSSIKIDGKKYVDGGKVDNTPVNPIYASTDCDTVIVVHLDQQDYKLDKRKFPGISVLEIVPSEDLGGLFSGTLNFAAEHSVRLMMLGYLDTMRTLKELRRNWVKEYISSNIIDESLRLRINELSDDEKYRLYNECAFLIEGNYAKLNYLTEDGFGKTILRVLSGGEKKAKTQMLENTVELQKKMTSILTCLDDEILELKIQMKNIFNYVADDSDALLQEHKFVLILTDSLSKMVDNQNKQAVLLVDIIEKLNEIINHPELKDKLTISSLPKWQNPDISDIKEDLEKLKQDINSRIAVLNERNESLKSFIKSEDEESKKDAQREYRLLRINPSEAVIISENGIERETVNYGNKYWDKFTFRAIHNLISAKQSNVLIIPEGMGFKYEQVIRPADYYMFLWFINTPIEKRSGRSVCMLDYYNRNMYVYGYEVTNDGSDYSAYSIRNNQIFCGKAKHTVLGRLERMFGVKYHNLIIFRTFSTTDNQFEDRLDSRKYYTIDKVDPIWEAILTQDNGQLLDKLVSKHSQNTLIPKITGNQVLAPLLK